VLIIVVVGLIVAGPWRRQNRPWHHTSA
jgi:hypothetical protein